jgi:micrococcal nuclease
MQIKVSKKNFILLVSLFVVSVFTLCSFCFMGITLVGTSEVAGVSDSRGDDQDFKLEESKLGQLDLLDGVYEVVRVVDGDTIVIDYEGENEKVRLIGIDAPESTTKTECFGAEASAELREALKDKVVRIAFDETQSQRDKYGRLLLYVWEAEDEIFINEKMVADGFAFEYTYDVPYVFQEEFKSAQGKAREAEKGLWGEVCACEREEISSKCTACNERTIKSATGTKEDETCSSLCLTPTPTPKSANTPAPQLKSNPTPTPAPAPSYVCNCSKTCGQMSSCREAYFQLEQCGCTKRDSDGDGVPCEEIC